jgi:hypothetical protein
VAAIIALNQNDNASGLQAKRQITYFGAHIADEQESQDDAAGLNSFLFMNSYHFTSTLHYLLVANTLNYYASWTSSLLL